MRFPATRLNVDQRGRAHAGRVWVVIAHYQQANQPAVPLQMLVCLCVIVVVICGNEKECYPQISTMPLTVLGS